MSILLPGWGATDMTGDVEFLHVPLTTWDYIVAALVVVVAASLVLRRFVTDIPRHRRIRGLLDDVSTWLALPAAVGGLLLVLGHSEMDALHDRYESALEKSVAQVRDSLSQMRKPRQLGPEQVRLVSEALKPFAGQPAATVSIGCTSPTSEAREFVQQLARAAELAQWKVETSYWAFGEAPGVSISYDTLCAGAPMAADAFVSALRKCHVTVQGPKAHPGQNLATPILVLVGEK